MHWNMKAQFLVNGDILHVYYFDNNWTNTRCICTHYNTICVLNSKVSNMEIESLISEIFEKKRKKKKLDMTVPFARARAKLGGSIR